MSKKLFVGNLPFSSTEEASTTFFSHHGEVHSVKIPTDQMTGRPRGFCFVEMENAEEAISALNNYSFEGRNIKVDVAQERPQSNRGGFSRGGRSGGGNGGGFGGRNRRGGNGNW